jgi:hypothetical protein
MAESAQSQVPVSCGVRRTCRPIGQGARDGEELSDDDTVGCPFVPLFPPVGGTYLADQDCGDGLLSGHPIRLRCSLVKSGISHAGHRRLWQVAPLCLLLAEHRHATVNQGLERNAGSVIGHAAPQEFRLG